MDLSDAVNPAAPVDPADPVDPVDPVGRRSNAPATPEPAWGGLRGPRYLMVVCVSATACLHGEAPSRIVMPSEAYRSTLLPGLEVQPSERSDAWGADGIVVVGFDLDARGRVESALPLYASPKGRFEAAALTEVRSWRFNPVPERRTGRKVRLLFRRIETNGRTDLELRAATPAVGDCSAAGFIRGGGGRRWAYASCGEVVAGRIQATAGTGWRSVHRSQSSLQR